MLLLGGQPDPRQPRPGAGRDPRRRAGGAGRCGVNVAALKARAFALARAYAGVGGALFAYGQGFVAPESFTLLLSFTFLGAVVVGGLGTVIGPVLGALFVVFVPAVRRRRQPGADRRDLRRDPDRGRLRAARWRRRAAAPDPPAARRRGRAGASRTARVRPTSPEDQRGVPMRSRRVILPAAGAATLLLAACGRDSTAAAAAEVAASADPGITDTQRSSSAAAIRSAARRRRTARSRRRCNGYFKKINAKGGVNGRKVEFITSTTATSRSARWPTPGGWSSRTRSSRSSTRSAPRTTSPCWDYLNQQKVPQLFVATGATDFGADQASTRTRSAGSPTT